jgi:uncharacterized protein YbjT (DUF2867 family)
MIVITGATGALGGATVEHLLKRLPAGRIGVSVRDVAKAQHFADRGVRVRRGSYDDPAALRDSFEGAEQILLVSQNDPGGDGIGLHRNAIEAAVAAGTQRILYTSHQNVRGDGPFAPAHEHAATEALLAESGVAWTSLRNGFYAHSLDWLLGPWQQTGVITAPADAPSPGPTAPMQPKPPRSSSPDSTPSTAPSRSPHAAPSPSTTSPRPQPNSPAATSPESS